MENVAKEENFNNPAQGRFRKFVEKIEDFSKSEAFLFVVGAVAFLFHLIEIDLFGILIFCLFAGFTFLFFKDGRAGLAVSIMALFIVSRKNSPGYMYDSSPDYYFRPQVLIPLIVGACAVIGTMIVMCVKNRQNYKKASLIIPLSVVALTIALSGIGREFFGESVFFGAVMGISYLGIYLLFVGCLNEREGIINYVATLFSAMALVVSLQIMALYVSTVLSGGGFSSDWKGRIIIGWGISNNAGSVLALFLPFTIYKTEKSKNYLFYLIISLFSFAMLVFTLSRTSLLMAAPVFAILFIKMLLKAKKRNQILAVTIIIFSIAIIIIIALSIFMDFSVILAYLRKNTDRTPSGANPIRAFFSGRIELWEKAWRFFLDSPIIGEGFARSIKEAILHNENTLFQSLFHNFAFQILGSSGIIGAIVFVSFLYFIVKLFLNKYEGRTNAICFGITFIGISLLDIIYFLPYCVAYLMFVVVAIEKTVDLKKNRILNRKKAVK